MKSIKTKIIAIMLIIIVVIGVALGVSGSVLNYQSSMNVLNLTMSEMVKVAADRIQYEIKSYANIAYETGMTARLSSADVAVEDKKSLMNQKAASHGFQRGNIIGADGKSIFDGKDFSDRDYVQRSMAGEVVVSEPLISKVTGEMSIIISAPLREGGVDDGRIVGVVYFVPKETFLNDIVSSIKIGNNGNAYILNKDGLTIAHKNMDIVGVENTQEDAKKDQSLAKIAALEAKMTAGESGFGSYTYSGTKKSMAYAPIGETDGWSVSVCAVTNEFIGGAIQSILFTIGICIAFIIVGLIVSIRFARSIANPIQACSTRLKLLSEGDLRTAVPDTGLQDETGTLIQSLQTLVKELNTSIGDVSNHLSEMGNGNFSLELDNEYPGDFSELQLSMQQIQISLNSVIRNIAENSQQVSSGSDQVSVGAQALAQGATEQASSVEELSATIAEISNQVKETAENAHNASQFAASTGEKVLETNEQMQMLMGAMLDISGKSGEIGKIIKSIEDIAFQTNILALNAAVEAARAGNAGKGFAVVADEVRNLASKSADAAKNTTELIEASLDAVENGTKLAEGTAETMSSMVEAAQKVVDELEKISRASSIQSDSIAQITVGIDQISSVVQTNSATAEESAAASEELSSQARILEDMVSKFKLKR